MTLRVILQIVPFGDEDKTYEIDRLDISNFGAGGMPPGTCKYQSKYKDHYMPGLTKHRRDDGAWVLVRKVLEDLGNKL